jgi:Rieske Fe-S protein
MTNSEDSSSSQVSRRRFMKIFAFGATTAGGAILLTTLESCSKKDDGPTAAKSTGQSATLVLANETALQSVGGFIRRAFGSNANGGKDVIVMRVADSGTNAFATASTVCTHQGCSVDSPSSGSINCPCHGSIFGGSSSNFGQRISGPAPSSLQTFATTFDGTTITITF